MNGINAHTGQALSGIDHLRQPTNMSCWATAGTMLVVGRMSVQRDPTLWTDPLRFDPDRQG